MESGLNRREKRQNRNPETAEERPKIPSRIPTQNGDTETANEPV
jgi:hypothetical protein